MITRMKNQILFPPVSRRDRYGNPVAGNRYRVTRADSVPAEFGGGISFTAESVYEFPTDIPSYLTGRLSDESQTILAEDDFLVADKHTAWSLYEDRLNGRVR